MTTHSPPSPPVPSPGSAPVPKASGAISKAIAVVTALAEHSSVSAIARQTGLPTSTVHRILQELVFHGWAREDGERGYLLGSKLLSLAGRASDEHRLARIARPFLRVLCDRTGHAVHFAVREGDEAVYLDKLEGRRSYHMRSRVGLAIPLYCTAIGKALLAQLPEEEVRALLLRTGMRPLTPRTITDVDALLEHLAMVAERGYAIDDEENEPHTCCIGAAVIDHRGLPIGGVSMSALAYELDEQRQRRLAPLVGGAAAAISEAIGGPSRAR